MKARRYIGGQLALPSPPRSHYLTKQEILRNLDFPQLDFDYKRFVFLINKFYLKHGISEKLQDLICECCEKTVAFMDAYPLDEDNIDRSMKAMVIAYEGEMQVIKERYLDSEEFRILPWRLRLIIEYSFGGITHFLWQFKLLINSYSPGPLPHAPTNWDRKECFIDLVETHQASTGSKKIPGFKVVSRQMADAGFIFSRRTYTTWRRELKNGTIKNWVQN